MQRVRKPHRGQSPSSARQLPILATLYARSPTLFVLIIHDMAEKVNPLFEKNLLKLLTAEGCRNGDCVQTRKAGNNAKKFVYFDEKTLESKGNPLAFCALLLYNNINLC